jgi:hypothetical protein
MVKLIATGHYSPTTANGWLAILRVIIKAAKRELGLLAQAVRQGGVAHIQPCGGPWPLARDSHPATYYTLFGEH